MIFCCNISQHGFRRVGGKFGAVKCCSGESAKRLRKRLRGERARFRKCSVAQLLRKQRSAGNRCGAAAAQKTGFNDPFAFDPHGELQNVAANGIADLHFGVGAGQFAGVARILKVVENGVAEHQQEYSNAGFIFSGADIFCRSRR
jgi:hypothetical protein